jgi:hypothetical protein
MEKISEMKISDLFAQLMESRASWKISAIGDSVRLGVDAAVF